MSLLRRYAGRKGITPIIRRGELGLSLISFGILRLEAGESYSAESGAEETALVVLEGVCAVSGHGFGFEGVGGRRDVFSGRPHCLYLPYGTAYGITATEDLELGVCTAPSTLRASPRLIRPEEVIHKSFGKDNWKRDAYIVIGEGFASSNFILGEAIVPSGNWGSFPPHRHDFDRPGIEADMEEVYFFRIDPPSGFAVQRVYTDDGSISETYTVADRDTVAIPRGYHPTVVAPGNTLYNLWVMAGRNRKFLRVTDPAYADMD